MSSEPVWEAGVINADVTSDVHIGCRAEAERLDDNIAVLEAEVERLRAALFKIADDSAHADQYVRWAQEALGGWL
jgi:uncharacterized small protein (DUF1192 family)